jgi:hypothetical protein
MSAYKECFEAKREIMDFVVGRGFVKNEDVAKLDMLMNISIMIAISILDNKFMIAAGVLLLIIIWVFL